MTDAFQVLEADHLEVKGMLAELESGSGNQGALAERLVMEESKHEAAEEMYFWPTVRDKVPGGGPLADQALHQEQEGKEVLDKLRKLTPSDPEFTQLVDTFARAGREHIAFEEEQVWPKLRGLITSQESEDLGSKLEMAKKTGPTRPHPGAPDSPGALKTVGAATAVVDKARDAATNRG